MSFGPEQWPEIARLYHDERLTLRVIAERFGVGKESIRVALRRHGTPPRARGEVVAIRDEAARAARAERPAAAPAPSSTLEERARAYAAVLASESSDWTPEAALERARAAYNLAPAHRPGGELRLPAEWRRACREHVANSRRAVDNYPLGEVR